MYYINLLIYYITYPFRQLIYNPFAVLKGPRKLLKVSLPTRVALLVWLFLVIVTVVSFVSYKLRGDSAGTENFWKSWQNTTLIILLIFAIPMVIRQALKLWLEGEGSAYPDIDAAWKAGLDALKENGIDPTEVPIFVLVGNRSLQEATNLFEASGLHLKVKSEPDNENAALHWFATQDSVYLCCTDTCWLSLVASGGGTTSVPTAPAPGAPARKPDDIKGTMVTGAAFDPVESPGIRSTATSADLNQSSGDAPTPPGKRNQAIFGTMVVGSDASSSGTLNTPAAPQSAPINIAHSNEQKARLAYVGSLLNRLRQPVCPINGILTLLPFDRIAASAVMGQAVQRAIKGDLTSLFEVTQLRCPVIAMVTGMETESGFAELVRRVGPDRAMSHRFGKGFDLWTPPIPEEIEAVAKNACGAFEDFTYSIFGERDALKKATSGNTKLYSLLCKIRSHMTERLGNILVDAYSIDSEQSSTKTLLFSGVYFVAAGDSEDKRAFVKAVFDKLGQEENELDWTEEALADDERYQNMANFASLISAVMIVAMVGMFLKFYFGS